MSEVELLINAIQERPTLWEKRNTSYHNRLLSHREWEAVAKIIGTTSKYNIFLFYYYILGKGCCSKYSLKFSLACAAALDVALYFL